MGSSESIASASNESSDDARKPVRAGSLSVNILCQIGATVGLGSIILPWIWVEIGLWQSHATLLDAILYSQTEFYAIGGLAFVAGTVLAFAFPLACGLQVAGLIGFYHFWAQRGFNGGMTGGLSIGFFLAILSCAVIVASVIRPVGPGCSSSRNRRFVRTQVAHRTSSETNQADRSSSTVAGGVADSARNTRQWVVALATAASLVVLSVGAASYAYRPPEPLVEIVGGVTFVVGPIGNYVLALHSWNGSELSVSDGIRNVAWTLQNESWKEPGWSSISFGSKNLSGLILTPTIVDWSWPGYMTSGDLVVLVAEWYGERFADGTTYTMRLIAGFPPPYWFTIVDQVIETGYTPLRGFEIDFEFQDGRLSSECQAIDASGDPVPELTSDRAGAVTALFAGLAAIVAVYWFLMVRHRGGDHKNLTR